MKTSEPVRILNIFVVIWMAYSYLNYLQIWNALDSFLGHNKCSAVNCLTRGPAHRKTLVGLEGWYSQGNESTWAALVSVTSLQAPQLQARSTSLDNVAVISLPPKPVRTGGHQHQKPYNFSKRHLAGVVCHHEVLIYAEDYYGCSQ